MIEYRRIESHPDYSVGSDGSVRSHKFGKVRQLAGGRRGDGTEATVILMHDGIRQTRIIAQLVAQAFLGPRPKGCGVGHKHDLADDSVENLFYGTPTEISRRRAERGTHGLKLTEAQVQTIREEHKNGVSATDLASMLGVHPTTIRQIIRGTRWSDLR